MASTSNIVVVAPCGARTKMKRGGCGMHAHGGHGGHDHGGHERDAPAGPDAQHAGVSGSTKDPVCGMTIDPKRAVGMRTARGRTFYFCSADCLAKFDADPEGMASRSPAEASRAEHVGCFLAISYVLCVSYDLLFGAQMYRAWVDLLPGFHWLSWGSFALGLVETIAYGVFFGLMFAPLYNFFLVKVWRHAS